jgi:hypothetical protein
MEAPIRGAFQEALNRNVFMRSGNVYAGSVYSIGVHTQDGKVFADTSIAVHENASFFAYVDGMILF